VSWFWRNGLIWYNFGKHKGKIVSDLQQTACNFIGSDEAPDIAGWLADHISGKTLLLICGGSAAEAAVRAVNDLPSGLRQQLSVSLTDERYGKVGHDDSNWKLLQDLQLPDDLAYALPVLEDDALNMQQTTELWGQKLAQLTQENTTVLAIFGIGADSHIAGLKPNSPPMSEDHNLAGCFVGEDFARITITPPVFMFIDACFVYTQGSAKQQAVELLAEDKEVMDYPDQLIKRTGSATVYYQKEK
jgi:6-phosphogluconolactonase/glucosamine-6-phosphate isomerase/deaminase